MPPVNNLTDIARKVFANDSYATSVTGITIDSVDETSVVCSLVISDSHRNAKGNVMGGAIFTLADFAFAIAANSALLAQGESADEIHLEWVSTSSTINFLSTPKGNMLTASTHRIRQGRSNAVFQVNIYDNQNRHVAIVTTCGLHI